MRITQMLNLNHQDIEISAADIQQLSSPNALTAFFATLGYDTNHRLSQTTSAMGITADSLTSNITHIERLASQDSGFFPLEIYLFQLKSITVSATQALARAFRDRQGDYLLVLTDSHDFDRLDFVLVERYNPDSATTPSSSSSLSSLATIPESSLSTVPAAPRSVVVRPRVLTVNRRQPNLISLRVLRRFTYTESDTLAQFDKLLSAYDVADWSEPYFNNRALFSDYYLTRHLPETSLWNSPAGASALTRAFRTLRTLYDGVRDTVSNQPTSTVRELLIQPILNTLGFNLQSVQPARDTKVTIDPHYRLYASDAPDITAGAPTEPPLALCLAYTWNRSLDGKDDRDDLSPDENPGASVVTLLDRAEAPWAIVTNGKLWRLYSASAHSRATNYYEIDLEETLALPLANLEDAFRYFWFMFRAAAFMPTGDSPSFLDTLISESERYARELGDRLKERVFEDIFPHFARGFILYARQHDQLPANLTDLDSSERDLLLEPYFSATLTFLYRLLFLLYAESRDLLPVRELHGYFPTSLERLKQQIADNAGPIVDSAPEHIDNAYNNLSTAMYDRLQELFHAIDKGDPALNVPVYNGGLFLTNPDPGDASSEAAIARFLSTHKVPDRQLALGLDRMARDEDEKRHDLVFIDYKSLGVRQLGSIYEGLLEFKLRIAPEAMVVVKGKKTEEIIPYAEAQRTNRLARNPRTFPVGHVYLENDRRERKATGSYYTPDYIVKYIVEHTVGPVLRDKLEALRPLFREAEQTLRLERDKARALKRPDVSPERETYKKYRQALNEAFFDLTVLDPAMGSGHFLVEAVDYITDRLADFLASFRWNPIVYELSLTRQSIQQDMERQGVTIDASKLTDLNLLKRQVLKRCIYGVDLNPMAVELAKVSLWLDCFTLGAPLSFLDHHMKHGNSLIGGQTKDVQQALSGSIWGFQFSYLLDAAQLMRRVGELSDVTAEQVVESRNAYKGAYNALAPFKRLLDAWISEYFGNKGAQHTVKNYAGNILDNTISTLNSLDQQAIATALSLSTAKHFFHWELEFPEIFYDEAQPKSNPGFDAVIGNPPYVRQEGLGDDKPAFKAMYAVFNSIADLYTYFIERGNTLLHRGGRFGMITANKFMRANYGAALRSFLTTQVKLENLIDFGDLPVFGDATTYPIIILTSSAERNGSPIEYALIPTLNFDNLPQAIKSVINPMPESAFSGTNWSLAATSAQTILDKLKAKSVPLGVYVGGIIRRGILTGFNEAFVIDKSIRDKLIAEDPKSAEIIKPFLVGEDVRRYALKFRNRYLIWTYIGVPINQYPAVFRHLEQYQAQLEKRSDQGNYWWELRHCDYYADFEKPKIVYPNICMQSEFAYDFDGFYSNQKTFIIPGADMYLLALLNCNVTNFIFEIALPKLRGGFFEPSYVFMKYVPIRRITFTLTPDQRASYLDNARSLYSSYLDDHDSQPILAFVDHHLAQQPEQSDVVHDLLAYLAGEMIRLNKEKRASMQQFLSWLESTLHILPDREGRVGIDVLTGKSKLLDFPGDYQKGEQPLATKEIEDILLKNKNKLGMSLNDSALLDRVKREYESSLERILPLKEMLEQTDRLIDAVVYRLYGLTEEEIAVVEGRG
jgi:hypothetical protein